MGARTRLELREQMANVALDRLLREEEALPDLPVDEPVGDELKHLDLAHRRFLLELAELRSERDHLGGAVGAPARGLLEPTTMVHVAAQDLLAFSSVHGPDIGRPHRRL